MYYKPCKECKNYDQCNNMMNMPMMDMPMGDMNMMNMPMDDMSMMNMPMDDMPMGDMNMMNMPMGDMNMMNMPMGNMNMMNMPMGNMNMMNMPMMPMMNMSMCMKNNEDLKKMYPRVYLMIHSMVKYHCDMMVSKHGKMYCPSKDEMDHMCKDICDKYEEHHKHDDDDDDDDDCRDNDMRQRRRYGRRRGLQDIVRILIIKNLIGKRRRHRREHWGY